VEIAQGVAESSLGVTTLPDDARSHGLAGTVAGLAGEGQRLRPVVGCILQPTPLVAE
jgi:hypothetical protein